METFSLTLTVHEWRIIAAATALNSNRLFYPHDRTLAIELANKIATQTGEYDSEGKRRK